MSKTLRRRRTITWGDILSPTIFKLDILDSFKYRKRQAWVVLFATLALFALSCWSFLFAASKFGWSLDQVVLQTFLYVPLLVALLFWFRACSLYDFAALRNMEEEHFITKKQARASFIFKVTMALFGIYYCYWMYQNTYL